ncbi:MAG: LacI family transcriptional regulator [Bacteroidetes bacterium]|jgi:LacI family transcriptional regulator|nr:MAG: LacI family transcriptional regulator [Bacteroidota bacterium]
MDNVNLKKLAGELNLAVSTVSRALRDNHEISQETRDRVKALAAKLGFQPNPHASSLRQNKSRTIAVVVPEIQNNFFSQVLNGVEDVAQQKGYHVLIYLTHEDHNREKDILKVLRNGRVDGLMISVSNTTTNFDHLEAYRQTGMPLVFFDRVCEEMDVPHITTDDSKASYKATEHLLKMGCKNIAFLSLACNLSISNGRRSGYLQALAKHGLGNKMIVECGTDDEVNRQKIRKLLQSEQRPDGIFAAIEKFAVNTYEVCYELNICIPQQLKVVSFSNLAAAALFNPPLSTVIQPAYEIGKEAATILFKVVEKKMLLPNEKKVTIASQIVERKSTGRS